MKLHYDPLSTAARAVTFFLYDQGLAFEEAVVSLHLGEHRTPGFLALNPSGQTPVLEDGDFVLTESSAILRYLALKTGSATYPGDPKGAARVDEAMSWFSTNFRVYFCAFLVYARTLPELAWLRPETQADMARLGEGGTRRFLTVLDRQMLGGRTHVCGDQITIADYLGYALVSLGFAVDFDFGPYPNVQAWLDRLQARAGWDAAHASFSGYVRAIRAERGGASA